MVEQQDHGVGCIEQRGLPPVEEDFDDGLLDWATAIESSDRTAPAMMKAPGMHKAYAKRIDPVFMAILPVASDLCSYKSLSTCPVAGALGIAFDFGHGHVVHRFWYGWKM